MWAGKTVQQLVDKLSTKSPESIVHISHPRGANKGYFLGLALDPTTVEATAAGKTIAQGFHALEVNSEIGAAEDYLEENDAALSAAGHSMSTSIPVMRDWFGFLQQGVPMTALGNSDSHDWNDGTGKGCSKYAKKRCEDGHAKIGQEWIYGPD